MRLGPHSFPHLPLIIVVNRNNAFIDMGAVECFTDAQWAKTICIPTLHITQTLIVTALDVRPLGSGIISTMT